MAESNAPLTHNKGLIGEVLDRLINPELIGKVGDAIDAILNELLDLNVDFGPYVEMLKLMNDIDLSRDTLLLLPLPIVAQDADGDKTASMTTVMIRDSKPELIISEEAKDLNISETDLNNVSYKSTDAGRAKDNISENTANDESADSGTFRFSFGYDTLGASATINGTDIFEAFSSQMGVPGEYGSMFIETITGPDANGYYTVTYRYQLEEAAEHIPGEGNSTTLVGED